ncbi:fimbrial protein [Pseudomonas sp. GW456-L14]|uniref:fimbrial protein n=1 Tax=unclassified Pseudomonas TaxID=196821 RepID=UPI000C888576|nr:MULTISPECIES: fimbrial protein [unclassified Pseudomonas]PMY40248.1 fimbrial protein [Pseudomonas sp. GW456-L14]PMY55607.1 fimbrial protein [Pseudomonas sp. GW456-L12]
MKLFLSILLLGVLSFSESGYALTCLKGGNVSTESANINTSIAVPNNAPKGKVLWRSPDYSMTVICNLDNSWAPGEDVYFYLSPTDQGMTQLGPDLEFGVNLGGREMTCSQLPGCRVKIGSVNSCMIICAKFNFPLSYNFFINKKSSAAESAGKDGPLSGLSRYDAFQIDGAQGINKDPAKNFRMTVAGLDRIRFVGCLAQLSVSPETVNFGKMSSANVRAGGVINEKPFTVLITKSCNSVYGISAVMKPVEGSVQNGDTLVPPQNASVGIRLLRENRTALPFNQEFELTEPSGDMAISKRFTVQLKWMADKAILGAFRAGATLDIYYK